MGNVGSRCGFSSCLDGYCHPVSGNLHFSASRLCLGWRKRLSARMLTFRSINLRHAKYARVHRYSVSEHCAAQNKEYGECRLILREMAKQSVRCS